MRWTIAAAAAACVLGCAPADGPGTPPAAGSGSASTRPVIRTGVTATGEPLVLPPSPWEAVISVSELPPGGALPMHRHPWARFVYVERGRVRVAYEGGPTLELGPGEALAEAVDRWHEAWAIGPEPVRLILFDQVPPGETNLVRR